MNSRAQNVATVTRSSPVWHMSLCLCPLISLNIAYFYKSLEFLKILSPDDRHSLYFCFLWHPLVLTSTICFDVKRQRTNPRSLCHEFLRQVSLTQLLVDPDILNKFSINKTSFLATNFNPGFISVQ